MDPLKIAQKANEAITQWSLEKPKLIVAIDGYTGIGKTTLLNNLTNLNPDIITVNRDDFSISRKEMQGLLSKAEDKSIIWELYSTNNKAIENLILAFHNNEANYKTKTYDPISGEISIDKTFNLTKKILVIEGVFMFHPQLLNNLWDKRIYLEGDIQKIDERRIEREKARWGKDYFPESHPDSYFRQVITAFTRYIEEYQPEKLADLVFWVD